MNQSMSRGSTFDLSKTNEVSSLEITIAMFEFPQGRLGRASVEDITDWLGINKVSFHGVRLVVHTFVKTIHVQLSHK